MMTPSAFGLGYRTYLQTVGQKDVVVWDGAGRVSDGRNIARLVTATERLLTFVGDLQRFKIGAR